MEALENIGSGLVAARRSEAVRVGVAALEGTGTANKFEFVGWGAKIASLVTTASVV